MSPRFSRTVLFTAVAMIAAPTGVEAQLSSWNVRVFPEGGYLFHMRNLGKNSVALIEQSTLQTVADLRNSPIIGGGVEMANPDRSLRFQARVHSTLGAEARGLLGICQAERVVQQGEGFCQVEEVVDASLLDASVEMVLAGKNPERLVRPLFSVGLGLRKHDFDNDPSACNRWTDEDLQEVCSRSREIFENPSKDPLLAFGFGIETARDPFSAFVHLRTYAGQYSGGGGITDGEVHIDLALTGGFTLRVR